MREPPRGAEGHRVRLRAFVAADGVEQECQRRKATDPEARGEHVRDVHRDGPGGTGSDRGGVTRGTGETEGEYSEPERLGTSGDPIAARCQVDPGPKERGEHHEGSLPREPDETG